ncbi:BA14K family protein (plasmid) [Rhizobium sp. CB3090]|uniref:BA14K family protein n=1 Tax=Rhizobium sp. CB3090 TaxID=3039156 RepID=UPI0024B1ADA8|nr:BA14K family protein [Rhizobium sp. CB3090]WFU12726.1 BA14K family protein [Rhizobium sp. CB3090]
MKAIALAAFGIASSIGACIAVASLASYVVAEPERHSFANLTAPDLWTTEPRRVDPRTQHYERLPPLYSTYVTNATAVKTAKPSKEIGSTATEVDQQKPWFSAEHIQTCARRYRSFDPSTNTYRSYDGRIRQCSLSSDVIQPDEGTPPGPSISAQAVDWCASRYRSYRREDNSYQPFEGPRRACQPPGESEPVVATK